jgi:hypothetical protein
MRLAAHRSFEVPVGVETAWAHLERLTAWPLWAKPIKSVEQEPPGPLTSGTVGVIRLSNGIRSRFQMRSWTRRGRGRGRAGSCG